MDSFTSLASLPIPDSLPCTLPLVPCKCFDCRNYMHLLRRQARADKHQKRLAHTARLHALYREYLKKVSDTSQWSRAPDWRRRKNKVFKKMALAHVPIAREARHAVLRQRVERLQAHMRWEARDGIRLLWLHYASEGLWRWTCTETQYFTPVGPLDQHLQHTPTALADKLQTRIRLVPFSVDRRFMFVVPGRPLPPFYDWDVVITDNDGYERRSMIPLLGKMTEANTFDEWNIDMDRLTGRGRDIIMREQDQCVVQASRRVPVIGKMVRLVNSANHFHYALRINFAVVRQFLVPFALYTHLDYALPFIFARVLRFLIPVETRLPPGLCALLKRHAAEHRQFLYMYKNRKTLFRSSAI